MSKRDFDKMFVAWTDGNTDDDEVHLADIIMAKDERAGIDQYFKNNHPDPGDEIFIAEVVKPSKYIVRAPVSIIEPATD